MKQLILKYGEDTVTVKQTGKGVEIHIPRNWRGSTLEGFMQHYSAELRELRIEMPTDLCAKAYHLFCKNKTGYTYNPWSGSTPEQNKKGGKVGYAVALTHNVMLHGIEGNPGAVTAFLRKHSVKLKLDDMYIGIWENPDNGECSFDLVKVVRDREDAVSLGRLRKQIAIYDLDKEENILLENEPYIMDI